MLKPDRTIKLFHPFFDGILVTYHQVREAFTEGGLKGLLRPRFFRNRKATPVVMDLISLSLTLPADILQDINCKFVELKLEDLVDGKLIFLSPSRGVKASRNLKGGWRGFAMMRGDVVVGDIWCVVPSEDGAPPSHSDLAMLGITCGAKDAYAFDMYISPKHRGENLAVPFQRSLQGTLKREGWSKVYGYYWNDNLPALWMHRVLKFKELPKRQVSRFLFYRRAGNFRKTVM